MYNPVSTYRLQFHENFTLADLDRILPYLQKLGVSTIYASPIFESSPGSTHGYDGVNPHKINPAIGNEESLTALSSTLKEQGLGWLQDIVPNHMAFHPDNPWLMDVLEKGPLSFYAPFFDMAPNSLLFQGRIMVPFLGAPLDKVIQEDELKVDYDGHRLVLKYYDSSYPLHLRSYAALLRAGDGKISEAIEQLLTQINQILPLEEAKAYSMGVDELKMQLASLAKNADTAAYLQSCLTAVNKNKVQLQQLAEEQTYHLCYWQETDHKINYRRFFTVNGLICLNIQDPTVFEHYHTLIKTYVDAGIFQGLRIDHIDGLYDPSNYLKQLRELTNDETYVVVEKILETGEDIPHKWPIQGNTGYDFLALVNNVFTQSNSEKSFSRFYKKLVNGNASVHAQIHEKKYHILYDHMGGERNNLYQLFLNLNLIEKKALASIHQDDLKAAIAEFLIQCPVYRYYGNALPLPAEEAKAIQDIIDNIRRNNHELKPAIGVIEAALLHKPHTANEDYKQRALTFYQRCMQFTGPLMAKGVEDTLMYTYNRFIGHNEVGDAPEAFGISPAAFHEKMQQRQQHWPLSINATSTHDTKRGEDVRARLNVLTALPDQWLQTVQEWQRLNSDLKQDKAPDANDEYFIYQTLIGSYPMPGQDEDDFANRLQEYLQKALREAKRHSNWTKPNQAYEDITKNFAKSLLDQKRPFWQSFTSLHQQVADLGIINSLAQVLLKFTCPGVPDVYQGTELWDLSLVDPDNRRAVSYEQREQWLTDLETKATDNPAELLQELWENRYDARIKLWLVHTLLKLRKQYTNLFTEGDYVPLTVEGKYKDHVLAFARRQKNNFIIVAVPLHFAQVVHEQEQVPLAADWEDTQIVLPKDVTSDWENLLLQSKGKGDKAILVKDIFSIIPLAVLNLQQLQHQRNAGILLPISSLASSFGIGDLGPEAKDFANFLHHSRQQYWQLLPISPTEAGQGHSPYSSFSSMAGNTLLISPELLAKDGLLNARELPQYYLPHGSLVDYEEATRVKEELFALAWQNFQDEKHENLQQQFRDYCRQEAAWLHDFALYVGLKQQYQNQAWFDWPDEFRLREPQVLEQFAQDNQDVLDKTKWLQFLFSRQWHSLKTYCNNRRIQLFGDMPFYTSYDSVDVWANQEIFSVNEAGKMTGVAGVPPDFFSEDGQLWGMPVFRWDVLKEQQYAWWIQRIRKNLELFDLLRLDHFRAFADYWDVPADEKTAKNGQWQLGPRLDFFRVLLQELGDLPFVAEDLGEIDQPVYDLRDEFNFPGMKILHFAFGDDMPDSGYIPHNYTKNFIAYTGTHDNNTTRGWYRQDADANIRRKLNQYAGLEVTEHNVHYVLSRLAYASVAKTAILPLQDVLGLDETARINTPGSTTNNWAWRLVPGQLSSAAEHFLKELTWLFNRG